MSRSRVATVLGVVATLAVLATAAVAISTEREPDAAEQVGVLTVHDPATGASFEVPADGWQVDDPEVRIYYTDERDRPVAVVHGPAVYRAGYCAEQPKDSNRGFAGFTRQSFDAWVGALGTADSESEERVTLADGTVALVRSARVQPAATGPCAAPEVYVAMVRSGDVQVVLVADAGAPGTLADDEVAAILTSLTAS